MQTVVDGRIVRKTVQKSFKHVEELLYFGEDENTKDVRKIISQHLVAPQHKHLKRATRTVICSAIKSYFDAHDVFTNVKVNGRKNSEAEFADEPGLDITEFYKMMTAGKINPLTCAVMMVKFQAGLDSSTLADRFNFYAYKQIAEYCGTPDHEKWDLEKCPVPIRLRRVKTTVKYTTFIDRDALSALKDYLVWKEGLHGPHDPEGPLFTTIRCIVTKLCPPILRRTLHDFIRLHRSGRPMPTKLDDAKIKYVIREKKKGTSNTKIADGVGISTRHVRRLWSLYEATGSLPVIKSAGRPAAKISDEDVRRVLDAYGNEGAGVGRVAKALRHQNISGRTVYKVMKRRNP